jgi:aspartate/glutamate racemase
MKKEKQKEKTKEKFLDAVTDQGVQVTFDALEVGQLIYAVAEDGTKVTLEKGTYLINFEDKVYEVVVDENGTITEINEVTSEEAMSNDDFKKTMDEMKQKIADLEEKIKTFTTAKPTATAKKTKPLTDDSNSNVRTDFSKIKVKF